MVRANVNVGGATRPTLKRNPYSKVELESAYLAWIESLQDFYGGKSSHIANAIAKNWPDRARDRYSQGLPNQADFTQIVRTWRNRLTLPNNNLADSRYDRVGVLDCVVQMIEQNVPHPPAGAIPGLSFLATVIELQEMRETSYRKKNEINQQKFDFVSAGVIAFEPTLIESLDEKILLLHSSEYQGEIPPYCQRDVDKTIAASLGSKDESPLIVVGPPKSGKTRTLIQNLKTSKYRHSNIYWLRPGGSNAEKLLEMVENKPSQDVLVLDDLQNPRNWGDHGLSLKVLVELSKRFRIVGTIHDYTVAQWNLDSIEHTQNRVHDVVEPPSSLLQNFLLASKIILSSSLTDPELDDAVKTLSIEDNIRHEFRFLASKLSSSNALEKRLEKELTGSNLMSISLFNALLYCKIIYPQGATLEELKNIARHLVDTKTNSPWIDGTWDNTVEFYSRGISPNSPHAIMMKGIGDRTKYSLFDPLWEKHKPLNLPGEDLLGLDLNLIDVIENAFELGYKRDAIDLAKSIPDKNSEIQCAIGRLLFKLDSFDESREWLLEAAKDGDHRAKDYLGDISLQMGNKDEALRYWREAAEQGNRFAMDSLGDLFEEEGDLEKAKDWWQKAQLNGSTAAMVSLAKLLVNSGNLADAEKLFTEAAEKGDDYEEYAIGQFYYDQGDTINAQKWFRKTAQKNNPWGITALGKIALDNSDFGEAQKLLKRASEMGFDSALDFLGDLFETLGDLDQATKSWAQAAELGNTDSMASLAYFWHEKSDFKEAESWYLKAAEKGNPWAMAHLGRLYDELGSENNLGNHVESALYWWEKAANLKLPYAIDHFGDYFQEKGNLDEARIWWERAASLNFPWSMNSLGRLELENKNYELADSWLRRACDLGNHQAMDLLGDLSYEIENYEQAEHWWTEAVKFGNIYSMGSLGSFKIEKGFVSEGIKLLRESAKRGNGWAMAELGNFDLENQRVQKAKKWFTKSAESGHTPGLGLLGDWHRQFGDIDEAEKLLLEASNLGHTWSGLQLGIIYCEKNNSVRACEIWTIAAEDGDVLAIKYLAEFYEEVEEFESAQHWFEKMAQNDSFYGYDHLGDFYNRLGDYKKAEECWSTSADLDNLYSCISLAKLNLTLGKEIDAEKWFLRASEIDFEQIIDQIIKSYREFNLQEQADFWDSKKQITQLSSGTKRD